MAYVKVAKGLALGMAYVKVAKGVALDIAYVKDAMGVGSGAWPMSKLPRKSMTWAWSMSML